MNKLRVLGLTLSIWVYQSNQKIIKIRLNKNQNMKTKILTATGQGKGREIELPSVFSENIRNDISQKFFEISKEQQPHSPDPLAGKRASASGIVRHKRHAWKTAYGHGISRVPRKIFWRRGTQFYWIGATISSARGGRAAHPPRVEHFLKEKKMNRKEIEIALKSAIAATASAEMLKKRYSSIPRELKIEVPIVVDEAVLKLKTKELIKFLREHLKGLEGVMFRERSMRAGRGRMRNRKYRTRAGLLMIIGSDEEKKFSGIQIRKVDELEISDLFPLGRLTVYTENAIKELSQVRESKENNEKAEKKENK